MEKLDLLTETLFQSRYKTCTRDSVRPLEGSKRINEETHFFITWSHFKVAFSLFCIQCLCELFHHFKEFEIQGNSQSHFEIPPMQSAFIASGCHQVINDCSLSILTMARLFMHKQQRRNQEQYCLKFSLVPFHELKYIHILYVMQIIQLKFLHIFCKSIINIKKQIIFRTNCIPCY